MSQPKTKPGQNVPTEPAPWVDYPTQAKNIPLAVLYDLRKKNLSYNAIAKIVGCTDTNVINRLQAAGLADNRIDMFREHRADLLSWVQSRILFSISDEDIKKARLGEKTLAIAQLYDKERLERGLATEHISVQGMVSRITTTLADYESRVNLLQDAMIERGISVTDLQDRSTIDTNLGISDNIDITNEP